SIMNNPHSLDCPDYTGDLYTDERHALTEAGLTEQAAVTFLQNMWKKANDTEKVKWDAKVEADRLAAEADLRAQEEAQVAAIALKEQELITAEKEEMKKNKSKYFAVNMNRVAPRGRDVILSTAVITKLKKGEYIPLYHFTNDGLDRVDHDPTAESNNSTKLVPNPDGSLSWEPVLNNKSVSAVKSDAELSIKDFCHACPHMFTAMAECGWPDDRCQMFHTFWSNIQQHEYRDLSEA
ncbi:hypothetical protein BDZ97DRAFT_1673247, partial [Flammula alnicola]